MKNLDSKTWRLIEVLIISLLVVFTQGCSTEKRALKARTKLEQKGLDGPRAWPKNYTYDEYVKKMNSYRFRQSFYKKRATQARIAKDKKTQQILNNNVEKYDKKISELKKDKRFYRVYAINDKKIQAQIKANEKTTKLLEKQNKKIDNQAKDREQEVTKQGKELERQKNERTKDRLKRFEKKEKELAQKAKLYAEAIEGKQVELDDLTAIAEDPENIKDATLKEAVADMQKELQQLKDKQAVNNEDLEYVTQELEKLTEANKKEKENKKEDKESQMKLSKDLQEQNTSNNTQDSIPN